MIVLGADAHKRSHTIAAVSATTGETDASHAVTVSQPGVVADLIDTAARATASSNVINAAA